MVKASASEAEGAQIDPVDSMVKASASEAEGHGSKMSKNDKNGASGYFAWRSALKGKHWYKCLSC